MINELKPLHHVRLQSAEKSATKTFMFKHNLREMKIKITNQKKKADRVPKSTHNLMELQRRYTAFVHLFRVCVVRI